MNSQEVKGRWRQVKGHAKQRWAELTDDDLEQVEGRRQVLVGKIQERYGKDLATAEDEVDSWMEALDEAVSD